MSGVLSLPLLPDDTKQQVQEVTGIDFNSTNTDFGGYW
jgi:hypothetical protein